MTATHAPRFNATKPPGKLSRRHVLTAGAAALVSPLTWSQASFPSKPITVIVPFTAGGASDVSARMLGTELGKLLGQSVVVENLAGAGGALAVQKLIRAPADGHTLLYGGMSESLLVPMINPNLGYKPEDMLPVALAGSSPIVFVVRPDFPANTMDELVALVRKNPGKYSFGSAGIGSFAHVMGELVKERAGMFMVHIPYRGGQQIITDVIAGTIELGITTAASAASMIASKRVKALGVSAAERVPVIKDVPTFSESTALKGLQMSVWAFIYAPNNTPAAVVERLNTAINTALMVPTLKEARVRLASDLPSLMTPAQSRAFIAAQQALYKPVTSRIKPE
jgi:tripartite-type tricarboxylate transporter receptor subunit TctC